MTTLDDKTSPNKEVFEVSETPLFPLNKKELLYLAKNLFMSGLPTSVTCICNFASGLVCLRYAGKYGNAAELAGVTLGYTWSNIFCLGILCSMNQGLCVLGSQLFGARKHFELGILFQKHLFVLSLVMIPLLLSQYFAETLLLGLGLDADVSMNTGLFLRWVIPSVIFLAYFDATKNYLMAQNCFYVQAVIQGILIILHIFWCHLFVDVWGMPVFGVALAKTITDLSCAVVLWLYLTYSGIAKESWIPWNIASIERWIDHLLKTLTIGANYYIEWMSYEISLFIIGAHGLAITVTTVVYMLPLGNSVSMQAYIGNAAGEGCPYKAQKYMAVGLSINAVMTLMNFFFMVFKSDFIADFFTNDERIKEILMTMISIYGVGHLADTFSNHISGTMRTLGNEKFVLTNFVALYIVYALSCGWLFGITLGYGYKAVWISIVSSFFMMCGLMVRKLYYLDWNEQVARIQSRLGEHKYEENVVYIEMKDKI